MAAVRTLLGRGGEGSREGAVEAEQTGPVGWAEVDIHHLEVSAPLYHDFHATMTSYLYSMF